MEVHVSCTCCHTATVLERGQPRHVSLFTPT